MKRLQVLIYSLIGPLFLVSSSCKKENEVYPKVQIKHPLSVGNYSFRDTLMLRVDVVNGDSRVSLSLMDGATVIPIANSLVYQQGSTREYELYFTDKYLESGKYEIRVLAFNGENRGSDFREIRYTELPLRLKGFVALSGSGNSATISSYDSIGDISEVPLIGDYPFMAFNSFQQVAMVAPSFNGQLTGFSFNELHLNYAMPNPSNPGSKQYECVFGYDQLSYAIENNGRIKGYNADGSVANSYDAPSGYIPLKGMIAAPGFLISGQEVGKNSYKLFLLNPQNGSVQKQTSVGGSVVDIGYAGQNTFVVTYAKNGDAVIATYNTNNNQLTEYARISGAKPLCLVRISDNEFLISIENKILRFNPHAPQIPFLLYSFAAQDMEYDALNDETYFAIGKNVIVSIKGQSLYIALVANDTIRQIELVYNK